MSDENPIELEYHAPGTDARGPTALQLLGGIIGAILGIVALSIAGLMVWMTLRLIGILPPSAGTHPSHSPAGILALLPALACFFAASVMFRMSLRLFRGKR